MHTDKNSLKNFHINMTFKDFAIFISRAFEKVDYFLTSRIFKIQNSSF